MRTTGILKHAATERGAGQFASSVGPLALPRMPNVFGACSYLFIAPGVVPLTSRDDEAEIEPLAAIPSEA